MILHCKSGKSAEDVQWNPQASELVEELRLGALRRHLPKPNVLELTQVGGHHDPTLFVFVAKVGACIRPLAG